MNFALKLSLKIFLTGVTILVIVIIAVYYTSYNSILTSEMKHAQLVVDELSVSIDQNVIEKVKTAKAIAIAPALTKALDESNAYFNSLSEQSRSEEIQSLNNRWKTTKDSEDSFILKHTDNHVSQFLKNLQNNLKGEYGEIFLTNKYGALVASTAKLTTLAHANKYWWKGAYNNGIGAVFFDDRGYDESVGGYVLGVVIPIKNGEEIIGILKVNLNILGAISDLILYSHNERTLKSHEEHTGVVKLIRSGGLIIFEEGVEPLSKRIPVELAERLKTGNTSSFIYEEEGEDLIVAMSEIGFTSNIEGFQFGGSFESSDHKQGNRGESWFVVNFLPTPIVVAPLRFILVRLFVFGMLLSIAIAIIALIIGSRTAKPLKDLLRQTEQIAKGDFDSRVSTKRKDEIGLLATSFNKMAIGLKSTTTSIDKLNAEIHEREIVKNELIKAKEKAEENQLQLKAITENSPTGFAINRISTGEVTYVNQSFVDAYHIPLELCSTVSTFFKYVYGEQMEIGSKFLNDVKSGIPERMRWDKVPITDKKTKNIHYVSASNIVLKELDLMISTVIDITSQINNEKALKESEEEYRLLAENSSDVIWVLNLSQQKFTYMSPAIYRLRGLTVEEALNESMNDALSPESFELITSILNRDTAKFIKNANDPIYSINEVRQPHKNGSLVWVEISSRYHMNESGEIEVIGVSRNIEERKQAEQELIITKEKAEESEKQFRSLVENIPGSTYRCLLDESWTMLYISSEVQNLTGYPKSDFIGENPKRTFASLMHPDDIQPIWENTNKAINEKHSFISEYRVIDKLGSTHFVYARGQAVFNKKGNPIYLDGTIFDITDRKNAEEDLIKAKEKAQESEVELRELNTTKDKLFSIIAHDLRSPFNSILGFSELLIENVKDFEITESEKYLGIINSSAKNTLVLLDNLLNWAKSQTGQVKFNPEKVVLSSVIQEIFELSNSSAKNKNISLNHIPSEEIVVLADPNMINTILRNLISNAIKFTKVGGHIRVFATLKQDHVEITISDNGVGMNEETQHKLFSLETNITTKGTANEKGSGLGLILCKEFVEKHGGKIWVESDPDSPDSYRGQEGKGSTFKFTLPSRTETVNENSSENKIMRPAEDTSDTSINKLKILIADDDETSEMLLLLAVKKISSKIIKVKTGTEAVEACKNNPDIDLVLMDIKMPVMNGFEATRRIREFNKKVIIVAQTAFAQTGDREKAIEAGCDDYIAKPINKEKLLEIIDKHF